MLALSLVLAACTTSTVIGGETGQSPDDTSPDVQPPDDSAEQVPGDTTDEPDDTDTGPGDDDIYNAFFDPDVIQTIEIELSDAAIHALNMDGRTYVEGNAVINGERFDSVGVRLKGSSTYEDLDCSDGYCKASFKIKLTEYVPDQKLGDTERITLNNMTTDYTQSKEVIVYNLLAEHSQLASRCSYATVTLNGQNWGLYANVESADDEWLKRRFDDPTGNFWGTGANYGDFRAAYLDSGGWVLKSGNGDTSQILAVADVLDHYGGDFFGELGEVINTDQFMDYWAWCATTGNYDGYPFHLNDVLIYSDPQDNFRFTFAPWGTDETWDEYEYTGQTWNVVYGRLGYACMSDGACVTELQDRISEALDRYDESDVLARAQAAWDLSEDAVAADPIRPFTPDYVWYYRDYYADLMPRYSEYVRKKVGI